MRSAVRSPLKRIAINGLALSQSLRRILHVFPLRSGSLSNNFFSTSELILLGFTGTQELIKLADGLFFVVDSGIGSTNCFFNSYDLFVTQFRKLAPFFRR